MKRLWRLAAMAASFGVIAFVGCDATSGKEPPANVQAPSVEDAGVECFSALGCPEGDICVGGTCMQSNPCNNSGTGQGCPTGQVCDDNFCKPQDALSPPSCRVNTDCPSGLDCAQGQCQQRTTSR